MIYRAGESSRKTILQSSLNALRYFLTIPSVPYPPPSPPPPQKKKIVIVKKMEKNAIWNYQFLYKKENYIGKVI